MNTSKGRWGVVIPFETYISPNLVSLLGCNWSNKLYYQLHVSFIFSKTDNNDKDFTLFCFYIDYLLIVVYFGSPVSSIYL